MSCDEINRAVLGKSMAACTANDIVKKTGGDYYATCLIPALASSSRTNGNTRLPKYSTSS